MDKIELENRTLAFTVSVIRFLPTIRPQIVRDVVGKQLLKAASSIGANYREANRAESRLDFTHKLAIVEKEASETLYWLDVLDASDEDPDRALLPLRREASELLRIFTRARATLRSKSKSVSSNRKIGKSENR